MAQKTPEKRKIKILIVDDEAGVRDLLRYLLEPIGYEICMAKNGLEAVSIVSKEDFDIIFMDVHMPGITGTEALESIKKSKPKQVIVIFSSSSDPFYVLESQAKEKGAFDCLYKPFELDDILKTIGKIINKERMN